MFTATMPDPRSVLLRSGCLVLFFISTFFFLLSIIIYSNTGLSYLSPGADDMGGGGDWTESMMQASVSI